MFDLVQLLVVGFVAWRAPYSWNGFLCCGNGVRQRRDERISVMRWSNNLIRYDAQKDVSSFLPFQPFRIAQVAKQS